MIPSKSNNNNGCTDNTSSNCVVWQGPDLTCVDICKGDTVSDVVARLAEKLCECCENPASTGVDIATVNQSCLITDYGRANTIQELLNNIIDKMCKCCEQSGTSAGPCDCNIPVPECLRKAAMDYMNSNSPITSMVLHDLTTGKGYAHFLATQICDLASSIATLNQRVDLLENRVTFIEQNCCRGVAFPPQPRVVVPNFTGSRSPVDMAQAIAAADQSYGELTTVLGDPTQINTAVAYTPALSQRSVLSGTGTMSSIKGWITTPRNLAQSFQNLWLTMNDTRNAVENLNETVAKPTCSDITYSVVGTVQKGTTGNTTGIILDFQETEIPTTFTECNSRGTKVTITDSSLNTLVKYVDVEYYQNNAPYVIATSEMGNLDLGSNYSVRIEFCASDGVTTCQEIQNITIENALSCPTLTIGTVTASEIPFTVSGITLPANKGYFVNVELQNKNGALRDSRSYTYMGTDITGSFTNLKSSTQYRVRTTITQTGSTHITECPLQLVSTTEPACSTVVYTPSSTEWKTATSFLQQGATTKEIATYNDGATQTKWQMGFDDTNTPIVVQATTTGVTGWNHQGEFLDDKWSTIPLTISGLSGSPLAPTSVTRSTLDSGWKFLGTITDPNSQLYYAYASINSTAKTVPQVVFSCTCDGLYLDTPQPVYYAKRNVVTEITIDAVGYTAGSGSFTWSIGTQPSHGTLAFKSGFPTSSQAVYEYTQNNDKMVADSFVITLTNECGTTIGTKYIKILPAENIKYTSTDVIVFFDTNSITLANARDIKTSFNAVRTGFSGGTKPNFYYVAVDGSQSGDYLKHVKGCVENVGSFTSAGTYGAAISYPTSGTWYTDIMNSGATLPDYWSGAGAELPPDVHIISFVSQTNANGTYGKASVPTPAVWTTPVEPTTNGGTGVAQYQEDYDAIVDITSGAAPTSAWGIACQAQTSFPWTSGTIPFTVSQVVVSLVSDIAGATAAVALQTFASIQGETLLTNQEYYGASLGLERYYDHGASYPGVDFKAYLLNGTASVNIPYNVTTNGANNTMVGLKDVSSNFFIASHMYIENGTELDSSSNSDITKYFRGMFGLAPTGSAGEPTGAGAQRMGVGSSEYAPARPSSNTAADACTEAAKVASRIKIYNTTGVEFDNSVKAYTSLTGAVNEQASLELIDQRWYALADGSTGKAVAQYYRTAPHWRNNTTC